MLGFLYVFVFYKRWRTQGRDRLLVNTLMYAYLSLVRLCPEGISPKNELPREPSFCRKTACHLVYGPKASTPPVLLDGLARRGVHATFFVIGENVAGNEELLIRMERDAPTPEPPASPPAA